MDSELEQMDDNTLEQLALSISVLDPLWRKVWRTYAARNYGLLVQVLKTSEESEGTICQ